MGDLPRNFACEHDVQNHTNGPHVNGKPVESCLVVGVDLGRHVFHFSCGALGRNQTTLSILIVGDIETHAQIDDHRTVLVDHDILERQVAVGQSGRVECLQALRK